MQQCRMKIDGKIVVAGGKHLPLPLCLPQIPYGMPEWLCVTRDDRVIVDYVSEYYCTVLLTLSV